MKIVEMAQSYRLCTWQKSKRLLLPSFPVIIVPRLLLYTHSDQRYIYRRSRDTVDARSRVCTASTRVTNTIRCVPRMHTHKLGSSPDFWVSLYLCISRLYSARGRYSSNTSSFGGHEVRLYVASFVLTQHGDTRG